MADEKKVRTPLAVALGVVVVLLIGFFGYRLLSSGGDSSTDTASSAVADAAGDDSTPTTTTTTPTEPVIPGQSFDSFATKNPFQPVISTVSPTTETTTATTTTTVSDSSTTTTDTVPEDQAPAASTTVSLLEVFDDGGVVKARIQVGVTVYTVAAGETFATSYKVVSLDLGTQCGQFQYGDSPFQLCVGEQTLK